MTSRLVNEKSDSCFSLLFSSRITARGFVFIGLNSFLCTTQCNRKCRALCVRVFNACNELAARNKAIRFHHNRRENDLTGWWRRTFSLIPTFCYIFLCFLRCVRFSSTICSGTFFLSLSFFSIYVYRVFTLFPPGGGPSVCLHSAWLPALSLFHAYDDAHLPTQPSLLWDRCFLFYNKTYSRSLGKCLRRHTRNRFFSCRRLILWMDNKNTRKVSSKMTKTNVFF